MEFSRNLLQIEIELTGDHLTWLSWMRDKYRLGSSGYALCMLIDYCLKATSDEQRFIFTVIRCKRCGVRFSKRKIAFRLAPDGLDDLPGLSVEGIATRRLTFLQDMAVKYDIPDVGKVCRVMLDWAQTGRPRRGDTDEQKGKMLNLLEDRLFVQPVYENCRISSPCSACVSRGRLDGDEDVSATLYTPSLPDGDVPEHPSDGVVMVPKLAYSPIECPQASDLTDVPSTVPTVSNVPTCVQSSSGVPGQSTTTTAAASCSCMCTAKSCSEWDEDAEAVEEAVSGASWHVLHHSLPRRQRVHAMAMQAYARQVSMIDA